ncbi:MAG: DUF1761 domain-containing protein [Flavobacteriales bacterium]|nr:DUF1761 domain-containing protein [Flavobacteriales bacterium]
MGLLILLLAALVPMVIGFIWYNPKVMGNAWMAESGMTKEKAEGANMPLVFGLSFVFACLLSFAMHSMTIHQMGVYSIFNGDKSQLDYIDFMSKYSENFRTFKHGLFHGIIGGLVVALPILATNALFERKSFKYIAINAGYWMITLGIMGGIICQWSPWPGSL